MGWEGWRVSDPTIRAATVEDARAIAEVHIASWKAAYGHLVDLHQAGDQLDLEKREQAWGDRIPRVTAEGFRTWVAESENGLVGFAFTRPTPDDDLNPLEIAELVALYLHPDHFGKGVGKLLIDKAVAGMRNQGFLQATLWVLEDNTRAIHFYRREGWKPDGTRDTCHRGIDAPALRFRLPL